MFCRKEGMSQAKQWLRVLGSADSGASADGIEEKMGSEKKNQRKKKEEEEEVVESRKRGEARK